MEAVRAVDGKIGLPQIVVNWIGDVKELGLFVEGDALILKKVNSVKLSEIAGRVEGEQPPLQQIVGEETLTDASVSTLAVIDTSTLLSATYVRSHRATMLIGK